MGTSVLIMLMTKLSITARHTVTITIYTIHINNVLHIPIYIITICLDYYN